MALHHLEGLIDTWRGETHQPTLTKDRVVEIFKALNLSDTRIFDDWETDPELKRKLEDKAVRVAAEVAELRGEPVYAEAAEQLARVRELLRLNGIERCTQLVLAGRKH